MSRNNSQSGSTAEELTVVVSLVGDAANRHYVDTEVLADILNDELDDLAKAHGTIDREAGTVQLADIDKVVIRGGDYQIGNGVAEHLNDDVANFDGFAWPTFVDEEAVIEAGEADDRKEDPGPLGVDEMDFDDREDNIFSFVHSQNLPKARIGAAKRFAAEKTELVLLAEYRDDYPTADAHLVCHNNTDNGLEPIESMSRGQMKYADQDNFDHTLRTIDICVNDAVDNAQSIADDQGWDAISEAQQADLESRLSDERLAELKAEADADADAAEAQPAD